MAMPLLNIQSGQVEQVADPQTALLQGTHAPHQDDTFHYYNPEDGATYETTGQHIYDRLKNGATLETPEMAKERQTQSDYGNRPVTALALGAARGLTFGGSDVLAAKVGGPEVAAAVKEIKERNPGMSITGEVGGIIIPTLLSSGASLVAEVAEGATAGTRAVSAATHSLGEALGEKLTGDAVSGSAREIVGNLAGKAVGSAIEGAAYGAGQSVSESALGEPAHVAENLAIGGIIGGSIPILGKLGDLVLNSDASRKALSKIATLGGKTDANDFYQFLENSSEGVAKRDLIRGGAGQLDELKSKAIEVVKANRALGETAAEGFKDVKFAKAEELLHGVSMETADNAAVDLQKQILDMHTKLSSRPAMYSGPAIGKLETISNDLASGLKKSQSPADTFKLLDETKTLLQKAGKAGATPSAAESEAVKEVLSLSNTVKTNLENPEVWGQAATMQQKMNSAYSEFTSADTAFKSFFMKKVAGEATIDPGKISNFLKTAYKPEGTLKAQVFQDYVDKSNLLRKAIGEFGGDVSEKMAAHTEAFNQFQNLAGQAKAMQVFDKADNLLGHVPLLSSVSPQRVVKTLGFLERSVNAVNESWMKELGKTFTAIGSEVGTSLAEPPAESSDEHLQVLAQLASDPAKLANAAKNATAFMSASAPNVANAAQQQLIQIANYLYGKMPKNPNQAYLGSAGETWAPSDGDKAKFDRIVNAAQDPMSMLSELRNGTLSPDTAQTVKDLYPNFFDKTASGIAQYVAQKKPSIPYERQLQLSHVFGVPMDSSMEPKAIKAFQSVYSSAQSAEDQHQQAQNSHPSVKSASSASMTPGQRLLSGH